MTSPHTEVLLLSDDTIGIVELADACAMSREELEELIEYGALAPIASLRTEPVFALEWMQPLRAAGKLRRDYDLDLFVVVIVMDYLRHISALEARLQSLQAQAGA
jgi:MerR HTH family regulatory protein